MADLDPKEGIWIVIALLLLLLFLLLYTCWDKKLMESNAPTTHRAYKGSTKSDESHLKVCVVADGQIEMMERNMEAPLITEGNSEACHDGYAADETEFTNHTNSQDNQHRQSYKKENTTDQELVYEIV